MWLYFCPACGDEDCGGSNVAIDFHADCVVWHDFAHDLGPEVGRIQGWTLDTDDIIEGLGPYTFDRNEYTTALRELLRQLQDEHRAEQTRLARLAEELGNRAGLWATWRGRQGRHRAIDE